jgi:hypothetical protein
VLPRGKTGIKRGKRRAHSSGARVSGDDGDASKSPRFDDGITEGAEDVETGDNEDRRASLIREQAPGSEKPKGPVAAAMKGRTAENWLNQRLQAANVKPKAEANLATGGSANRMLGLTQFGVDAASLERLGLNSECADRVYRAMFVYSQGLHAVLQEAVGKSKNCSQALLVLWRAFTTVLEHAGQSEEQGAESLAALVQRGNEEEKARIESEYRGQMVLLQAQTQKLGTERRESHLEIQRLREDEVRLRNDSEMYRNEHQVAMSKYEREIKQRVEAEVRFLEKTRWADALEEDLNKERKQTTHYAAQLQEALSAREAVQVEVDGLRTQVKMQEAQAGAYKQGALEAAQQKNKT